MKKLLCMAAGAVLILAAAADSLDRKTGREPGVYEGSVSVSGSGKRKRGGYVYAAQGIRPMFLGNFLHQILYFFSNSLRKMYKWKKFWKS